MLNVELLKDTLEHIKTHPQQWRQSVWFTYVDSEGRPINSLRELEVEEVNSCGTAYCFAGHAALRAGISPPPKISYFSWYDEKSGAPVDSFAQKALGITVDQATALFSSNNDLDDLERMVGQLIEDPDISGSELSGRDLCDCGCEDEYEEEDYCGICNGPCVGA